MARLILKRLVWLLPSVLLLSFVIFVVLHLVPGDPARAYLAASQIPQTDEALERVTMELGLDQSLFAQYWQWFVGALSLDFGTSYMSGESVLTEFFYYAQATLSLSVWAMVLTCVFIILFGYLAATYKGSWIDRASRWFSVAGAAIPSFWLGFLLTYAFSYTFGWLPSGGRGTWQHYVLPVMTLSVPYVAIYSRLFRTSLLEVADAPWMAYGRARGLTERTLRVKHQLRHGLLPLLPVMGIAIGYLLAGTFIVESVFSWPGIGRYIITAIVQRDYPVIQFYILSIAVVFLIINMIVDLLQMWLDPRLRREKGGTLHD